MRKNQVLLPASYDMAESPKDNPEQKSWDTIGAPPTWLHLYKVQDQVKLAYGVTRQESRHFGEEGQQLMGARVGLQGAGTVGSFS